MSIRAQLALGQTSRLGRFFAPGARGTAEPLHQGDEHGLFVFVGEDGSRLVVARSALKLGGEKEPAALPPRAASRWRSLDSSPAAPGSAELEALLRELRGGTP